METLNLLDLFSGIGGYSLGLERSGLCKTVAFCEIEKFPQQVLRKHWPGVPIYDDIRRLSAAELVRDGIRVDAICGGFPCQDISSAGLKIGIAGARSGLWSEYARLIGELQPRYVFVENVAALLSRGLSRVLGDLASIGYDAEWHCISASNIGAWHGRPRVWIIAYSDRDSKSGSTKHDQARRSASHEEPTDTERGIVPLAVYMARAWRSRECTSWDRVWPDEDSPLGMGVDDGLPQRLDRLSHLGSALLPQIPELIGRAILEYELTAHQPIQPPQSHIATKPLI